MRLLHHQDLARFLEQPSLDDDFGFGEQFDGVSPLAVKNAEEAYFSSSEREIGHRCGDTNIDADIPRGGLVAEFAGGGTAGGEKRGLVTVGAAAQKFHGFINRIGVNETE